MNKQFESFGEHIRNLLSPYATIVQILENIVKEGTSLKEKNMLIQFLLDENHIKNYRDNLENFINFLNIEENEKMNWRETKLFKDIEK